MNAQQLELEEYKKYMGMQERIQEKLYSLERDVLNSFLGYKTEVPKTIQQISIEYNITRRKTIKILKRAIIKLYALYEETYPDIARASAWFMLLNFRIRNSVKFDHNRNLFMEDIQSLEIEDLEHLILPDLDVENINKNEDIEAKSRVTFVRLHLIPDILRWVNQCIPDPDFLYEALPFPTDLVLLSDYVTALVLTDGLVIPEECSNRSKQKIVPNWAWKGYCYWADSLETIVSDEWIEKVAQRLISNAPQEYKQDYTLNLGLPRIVWSNSPDESKWSIDIDMRVINYLAWKLYTSSKIAVFHYDTRNNSIPDVRLERYIGRQVSFYQETDVLCDTGYMFARLMYESQRVTIKKILEYPFSEIMMSEGDVQLPLILATLISRIDSTKYFFEELFNMRKEFLKVRERFYEIEDILSNPDRKNSGKEIRLLLSDLNIVVKKSLGFVTEPSPIEVVSGLITTDILELIGKATHQIYNLFTSQELRLLSKWTETIAFDSILKLRKIFKTGGTDKQWYAAAQLLQQHGAIAWYPYKARRLLENKG